MIWTVDRFDESTGRTYRYELETYGDDEGDKVDVRMLQWNRMQAVGRDKPEDQDGVTIPFAVLMELVGEAVEHA